jgi:uncharacterized membrane protein YdjX (TVP38/TMEM64 family)
MKSRAGYASGDDEDEEVPFRPLEETMNATPKASSSRKKSDTSPQPPGRSNSYDAPPPSPPASGPIQQLVHKHAPFLSNLDAKKVVSGCLFSLLFLLVCDSFMSQPENRILKPDFANRFLVWVQDHPARGLIWILIFMSIAVIFMVPIGTPITLGCGFIYKGAYGWKMGVLIATVVSMLGSALGAVVCFLLGRYLMRETVRKWIRKYPLFDAIDIASAEHGLRIMAMLYLTPILPLGPVSYMCGTTSMSLSHFVLAKVAALPLMMLYVFIGASTGTLIGRNGMEQSEIKNIQENETLLVSGLVLSFISIGVITHYIKKELNKILERQKRQHNEDGIGETEEAATIELGKTSTATRQRKH